MIVGGANPPIAFSLYKKTGVEIIMNQDTIGNLTTIIKIIIMTIAPAIAVYLGTSQETVAAFLTAVLTFVLAVYDAKYPNTFNKSPVAEQDDGVLNDEYTSDEDEC